MVKLTINVEILLNQPGDLDDHLGLIDQIAPLIAGLLPASVVVLVDPPVTAFEPEGSAHGNG